MAAETDIEAQGPATESILAPLKHGVFRRIWTASLGTNFGSLIQSVGAAWAMTELSSSAGDVALVQTASFTPTLLLSLIAGALADMYDRRVVGLVAVIISITGAVGLTTLAFLKLLNPATLLSFCFIVGTGSALFGPAWAASVREQVPPALLPQAISLNSISYNIARSFAPAIGGALVAAAGAAAAFVTNCVLYLPMLLVLATWRRKAEVPRLPPESLGRAMISGVRFVSHSPPIRTVIFRTLLLGMVGGAVSAMMPLVARDLIGGKALTYGLLLGAFGGGAVLGALTMSAFRARFVNERIVVVCMLMLGAGAIIVSQSRFLPLTATALLFNGAAWMVSVACYNIEIQLAAPRWVSGRTLAAFQAAVAGGIAAGGIVWGRVAQAHGVATALLCSGIAMLLLPLLGIWLKMPAAEGAVEDAPALADPEVALALTARSGPIVVELHYRVDPAEARLFYLASLDVQRTRERNGGYGWSISRDIADPTLWIERFHCPTWHDYLRQRSRATQAERDLQQKMREFHLGPEPVLIRRMLDRPLGSVRWREDTPDVMPNATSPLLTPGAPLISPGVRPPN
ncbi:MAG: MFS transporter [Caulobacteraceae bacterium]|nr:MFS transporter [Caulobacteraceae bacterium]